MPTPSPLQWTKTFTFAEDALPSGLRATSHTVGGDGVTTFDRTFTTENVYIRDGYLVLRVPGRQSRSGPVSCGEVATDFKALYGSMRTWAILSGTSGVCNGRSTFSLCPNGCASCWAATDSPVGSTGLFLYYSDTQETDVEWLGPSADDHDDCVHGGRGGLHFVNQAVDPGKPPTQVALRCPADATTSLHEYRIDWNSEATLFYLDGELQAILSTNVPSKAACWMWNCWTYVGPRALRIAQSALKC